MNLVFPWQKTRPKVQFLGLEIDTVEQCIRIPSAKILEFEGLLRILIDKKKSKNGN